MGHPRHSASFQFQESVSLFLSLISHTYTGQEIYKNSNNSLVAQILPSPQAPLHSSMFSLFSLLVYLSSSPLLSQSVKGNKALQPCSYLHPCALLKRHITEVPTHTHAHKMSLENLGPQIKFHPNCSGLGIRGLPGILRLRA